MAFVKNALELGAIFIIERIVTMMDVLYPENSSIASQCYWLESVFTKRGTLADIKRS